MGAQRLWNTATEAVQEQNRLYTDPFFFAFDPTNVLIVKYCPVLGGEKNVIPEFNGNWKQKQT